MKLSVIIPTYNEEEFLPNCLKSVQFADEILVLDSGSTDKTLDIAKKAGAKVISYEWQGFKYAHELGAKEAQHEWILYVDADERVSKKLKEEIQRVLDISKHEAYQMPRKNFIMGKFLQHGGWYPDYVTRLMKKTALKEWVGELHEYPRIVGTIGTLENDLYHLSHRSMDWMLEKTRKYTKMYAQILYNHNHPKVTVKNFFGAMAREFYFRAIKMNGYKDGLHGWLEILYQTCNAFIVQVQLWELQQKESMEEKYKQLDRKIADEF